VRRRRIHQPGFSRKRLHPVGATRGRYLPHCSRIQAGRVCQSFSSARSSRFRAASAEMPCG
jgi:hypothetical protein